MKIYYSDGPAKTPSIQIERLDCQLWIFESWKNYGILSTAHLVAAGVHINNTHFRLVFVAMTILPLSDNVLDGANRTDNFRGTQTKVGYHTQVTFEKPSIHWKKLLFFKFQAGRFTQITSNN